MTLFQQTTQAAWIQRVALLFVGCFGLCGVASAQAWLDRSPGGEVFDFVINPTHSNHAIVQTAQNPPVFFETYDGGLAWQPFQMPSGMFDRAQVKFGPAGEVFMFVGRPSAPTTGARYVYRRTAGTWNEFGPTTQATLRHWAGQVAVGQANSNLIAIIMVEEGDLEYTLNTWIYLSADDGLTWSPPSLFSGNPIALEIVETGAVPRLIRTDRFYPSTGTETFLSTSNDWSAPETPLLSGPDWDRTSLATSRRVPGRWLFSHRADPAFIWNVGSMLQSNDAGLTWFQTGPAAHFSSLQQGNLDPQLVVRHRAQSGEPSAAQVSRDGGNTWTSLPNPIAPNVELMNLVLSADDSKLFAYGPFGLFETPMIPVVGTSECWTFPNTTGSDARITAHSSTSLTDNSLILRVADVPANQFGLLLTSQDTGFVANPAGSIGNLCLGGTIGRFNSLVQTSGSFGEFYWDVNLSQLPTLASPVSALPGETWRFQTWFRDQPNGQPGSNFSNAVAVLVAP